jgi:eukaryotic-like serine/threonine-protein kinase
MATPFGGKRTGDQHVGTCLAFPPGALAAPLSRYSSGSVLSGKYRLESLIGEGGMGAVWRASNLLLGLPVAIKLIRADLDRDALRARLQLEARSVAKLGHPAIVRVYDVGETELGDPFIVMELLHGETLAQLLARGRLSAVRAVQLMLPIIDALAVAHARGIVHRDLKPDNLLIASEDQRTQPKILDFGIAKLTDPRDANHRLTEIGTVVGSPDYMSPEQARGREDVDYCTDIWSLCVVLYEAITGLTPFSASNYNALLRAIVEDDPKPLSEHAAGDAPLWKILKKGLSKDPQQRQCSMVELGRALAAWLMTHGAHEDACNTSLESKWFGRNSDPLGLGEVVPENPRPISASFQPKLTRDPRAASKRADSRGPFTATIRRKSGDHKRTFRALAAACALIGAIAAALAFTPKAHSEAPLAHAATAMPQTESAIVAPLAAPAAPVAPPTAAVTPVVATTLVQAKPIVSAVHNVHPIVTSDGTKKSTGAPTPRAVPSVKTSLRELDLISPY